MHQPEKVQITYQGAPLTEKFLNEHPEIHELYPSKYTFMNEIYLPLLKKAEESKRNISLKYPKRVFPSMA